MHSTANHIAEVLRNAAPDAAPELAKPVRKRISSLGHLIGRFAEACDQLRKTAERFPELEPWLREFADATPCALSGNGWFGTAVTIDADGKLYIERCVVDREVIAPFANAWNRHHPDKLINPDFAIEAPSSLRSPVWLALLRLRPLRDFWERELRRATVDTLLDLLPDAWLLDPTPLPPGSVIPRLELASWSDLDFTSRKFIPGTTAEITAALSAHPVTPGVLTSLPVYSPDAVPLLSFYLKSETRVDWLGVSSL